jgi:hypothetical protein
MIIEIYHLIFSSRPSENLLKCFSRFCNLFSQIFHFFHIFNFWWNNHWNISSDFHFFIRLNQICPKLIKMDQTWSNWIYEEIIIEIYRQIFNLIFFWLTQISPKGIKMDLTWSNWIFDETIIEIYHQIFNFIHFLTRLNQLVSKMDQTWSNWISDEIIIEIYHQIFNFIIFYQVESDLFKMDQNGSNLIKLDQTWSNLISDEIIIEIYRQIFHFIYFLIRLNQICPKWIKLDQIIFLMK